MRHEWSGGWWETESAIPSAALRPYIVGGYSGWTEHTARPVQRRETAGTIVPLILNFGAPYALHQVGPAGRSSCTRSSFLAGVYDGPVLVDSARDGCALQVNFTVPGARMLLGMPMHLVAGRCIDVADLFGADSTRLLDAMQGTEHWPARFALLDAFLLRRLTVARALPAPQLWAWDAMVAARGTRAIGDVAEALGWSRKRMAAAFLDLAGVTPKLASRLLRFEAMLAAIPAHGSPEWARLATRAGYYDQAHLHRDFREFAGCTPVEYVGSRLDGGGGDGGGVIVT